MSEAVALDELREDEDDRVWLFTGEAIERYEDGVTASRDRDMGGTTRRREECLRCPDESTACISWLNVRGAEFSCELHDGNPVGLVRSWSEDGHLEEEQFFDGHGGLVWSRRWNAAGDLVEDTSFTARTT